MRRLKYPKKQLFFNALVAADVGVYDDAKYPGGSVALLNFKKEGITLPSDGVIDTAAAATAFTGPKIGAAYTDDGIFQSMLLKFNAPAAAEDAYYDFGLTLRKKVKTPGVNTFHNNSYEKTYGGTLDVVSTTGGYVVDADKLTMENKVIDNITNDISMHSNNTDLVTNFAGSIVDARRVYLVDTIAGGGTETISLYDEDGVLSAGTTVTIVGATIQTTINALNADAQFTAIALAVAASTTSLYIIFKTAGYKGTVVVANETINLAARYVHLVAKSTEVQFDAIFTGSDWTAYNFGIMRSTYADDNNFEISVNSLAAVSGDSGADAAAMIAIINGLTYGGATAGTYLYAGNTINAGTPNTDIVLLPTVTAIGIAFNETVVATGMHVATLTPIKTTNYLWSCPGGQYPSLTSDDVQRAVWNLRDAGKLPAMYSNDATDGSAYAKYSLLVPMTDTSTEGISHNTAFLAEVDIYMLKTAAWAETFDLNDSYDHTTPDCNFECLLGIWTGVDPENWAPGVAAR